jgi:DNA-binding transcriptional LysR family regulator
MSNFIISPEDCLIMKAFKDSSSLREAARLLDCDPAGLARKVQLISAKYGFLQKVNNRWQLNSRGLDLVAWTEASIQSQIKILSEKSSLRIATTMWFSEEVIVPNLSVLKSLMRPKTNFYISVPDKPFELALIDGSVDFVIVCHPPENPEIVHKQINLEKWILIAPSSWRKLLHLPEMKLIEELKTKPFIRHSEINENLFLPEFNELPESFMTIDNLIGIRSAVASGGGWSLVPKLLVSRYLEEKKLIELPFEMDLRDRKVCVWWLRNRYESRDISTKICSWVKEAISEHK